MNIYVIHAWEIPREKMSNSLGGLELRLEYHLDREREGRSSLLRRQLMAFREDEWARRGRDGKYDRSQEVPTSNLLSSDKRPPSLADDTPGEGI